MKKSFKLVTIALLLVSILVGCSSEVESVDDANKEVVYANFGTGTQKSLETSVELNDTAIENLYWFYKATQTGGSGKIGETAEWVKVSDEKGLSGSIGPFSVASWEFTLKGCSDAAGESVVNEGAGSADFRTGLKKIPVTLSSSNKLGRLSFGTIIYDNDDDDALYVDIKVDGESVVDSFIPLALYTADSSIDYSVSCRPCPCKPSDTQHLQSVLEHPG